MTCYVIDLTKISLLRSRSTGYRYAAIFGRTYRCAISNVWETCGLNTNILIVGNFGILILKTSELVVILHIGHCAWSCLSRCFCHSTYSRYCAWSCLSRCLSFFSCAALPSLVRIATRRPFELMSEARGNELATVGQTDVTAGPACDMSGLSYFLVALKN